ncbi:hypothetical protein [Enterobacter pseudoroggenkampii]|uniref:hypothetical protein n=1 Tax=Enterobacter pseudoroggenkampii TaxID=2996112 RepID=UPI0029F96C48|nr:hypothetical protein [Enterobacter ludwigii]
MNEDTSSLQWAFEKAKLQMHPVLYLVPDYSSHSSHPYCLCDTFGSVLFISYSMGVWEEFEGVCKKKITGLLPFTEERAFQCSTAI